MASRVVPLLRKSTFSAAYAAQLTRSPLPEAVLADYTDLLVANNERMRMRALDSGVEMRQSQETIVKNVAQAVGFSLPDAYVDPLEEAKK